jgi:peptidoglycan hydrolase-like protein with peptidoglycan-binding domain
MPYRIVPLAAAVLLTACQSLSEFGSELRARAGLDEQQAAETAPPAAPPAVEMAVVLDDRASVKRAQVRLADLGYAPGPVDGVIGPRTLAAIRRYQTEQGLVPTGEVTPPLLRQLEAMSVARLPDPPPAARRADAAPPVRQADAAAPPRRADGPAAAPDRSEDLPAYRSGTGFVYSDGSVERVVATDRATVQWQRSNGIRYSAPRNFLLPHQYWALGRTRGAATVDGDPDTLWPHRQGEEVAFTARIAVQRAVVAETTEHSAERWLCRNGGERDVDVAVGRFRTVVFVCRRNAAPGTPGLVRTWYYAPAIRHYVRYVESDRAGGAGDPVDLVAVQPGADGWPPIVRAALDRAVVQALESKDAEARMPWTSSGVDAEIVVEAGDRFADPLGRSCRRFAQVWDVGGQRWTYPALACRTASGSWRIPGLDGDTALSLATSEELS